MKRLWDPYDPDNIRNPYQMYDRMRETAPIFRAQTGEWIVTRYDDAFELLGNNAFIVGNRLEWMKRQLSYLKDDRVDFQAIVEAMHAFIVLLNPPQHTRVRTIVSKAWRDHSVEMLIHNNMDILLAEVENEFDLIADFAQLLPVMTISQIMGIKEMDYHKLKRLSEQMVRSLDLYPSVKNLVKISEAASQFLTFFREYIYYRKSHLESDLVSEIIRANQEDNLPLSDNELISICIFLFVAGEETTVNLIGNGMLALFEDNEAFQELRHSPELLEDAVNEFLRFDAPVQLIGRIAESDQEFKGYHIPKGSTVTIALGAANRDPTRFENPNQLLFDRTFKQHLALGRGKHFCLGSWLARVQGKLAIERLLLTYPNIKRIPQPLIWNKHLALRGLRSLPVRVG